MADNIEDCDVKDFIKMEIDIDEDVGGWALEEDTEDNEDYKDNSLLLLRSEIEKDHNIDPVLQLKPIIYTTKLDYMHTINRDLKEKELEEIVENIISESKPKLTLQKHPRPQETNNIESYIKLVSVIEYLNFKARLKTHTVNTRNSNLLKQCKPLCILLKDINKTPEYTKALKDISNEFQMETSAIFSENYEAHDNIEPSEISNTETCEPLLKKEIVRNKKPILEKKQKNNSVAKVGAIQKFKKIAPRISVASVSSGKKTKITKVSNPILSDDEDIALINLKKYPVQATIIEIFALIVLLHKKKAHIYRINPTKLVTDYYISKEYSEYELAVMYPRDEKIIGNYCCWFKRDETVTNICLRKNYSFTIQKFLKQPHMCPPGECQCCCYSSNVSISNTKQQAQKLKTNTSFKSLDSAEEWMRGLSNRKQSSYFDLINKAMCYIPKTQVKEKPVVIETEKYLESTLLCIKCICDKTNQRSVNNIEMYEIGKNGHMVRSYHIRSEEESTIRMAYISIGLQTIDKTYCCWYTRQKVMKDLHTLNVSPTVLKVIQTPHSCEKSACICCCKPLLMCLRGVEILPPTLKHTTSYEKNAHVLTINFNLKSKLPLKPITCFVKSTKTPNILSNSEESTNDSTESDLSSSTSAKKKDIHDLTTRILSKFTNLKLDVTVDGKLEAVLNSPARNLTIAELKVLSDILALSTRQITELKISPKEFCKRINDKNGQSNNTISFISPDISPPKISLPGQQIESQDLNKSTSSNEILSVSASTSQSPTAAPTLATKAKLFLTMYSSITSLMETKNKSYANSFKSFFNTCPTTSNKANINSSLDTMKLPKILDAYTLAKSSTKTATVASNTSSNSSNKVAIKVNSDLVYLKPRENPRTRNTKRKTSSIDNKTDKKIRVKSPSKLLPSSTAQTQLMAVESCPDVNGTQNMPNPILIKRDPETNIQTIVGTAKPISITLNPGIQSPAFIIGNHVGAPNVQIVNATPQNLYQLNGNGLAKLTADQTTVNNRLCYLAVTPMSTAPSNSKSGDKSILARILKTPQVEPTIHAGGNRLPPLVLIRPPGGPGGPSRPSVPVSTSNVSVSTIKLEDSD